MRLQTDSTRGDDNYPVNSVYKASVVYLLVNVFSIRCSYFDCSAPAVASCCSDTLHSALNWWRSRYPSNLVNVHLDFRCTISCISSQHSNPNRACSSKILSWHIHVKYCDRCQGDWIEPSGLLVVEVARNAAEDHISLTMSLDSLTSISISKVLSVSILDQV